jgi:hypothetical protein
MRNMKLPPTILAFCLMVVALPAQAYLDPNSGGLLFQVLMPLFIGLMAGWSWLKRGFRDLLNRVLEWAARR